MKKFTLYFRQTGIASFATFSDMIKYIIKEEFSDRRLKYSYTADFESIIYFEFDFLANPKLLSHEILRESFSDGSKFLYVHYVPQTVEEKSSSVGTYDIFDLV